MYVLESHTFSASCKTTAAVFTVAPPVKKRDTFLSSVVMISHLELLCAFLK